MGGHGPLDLPLRRHWEIKQFFGVTKIPFTALRYDEATIER